MSLSRPVSVAVLGAGHLGTYHARIYRSLPEAHLVAVIDVDPRKAEVLAREVCVRDATRLEDVLDELDAVSIATPTVTHAALAEVALRAGKHVLIEKPITAHAEEARRLIRMAQDGALVLAVGQVERWNPAVIAARPHLGRPRFIESHRLAPFVARSLDVDVVLDLMIHDLDLTLSLVREPIEAIDAVGVPVLTGGEDIANARLRFANGAVANLTASRVSRERVRKLRVFAERSYVSIDLAEGKLERVSLHQRSVAEAGDGISRDGVSSGGFHEAPAGEGEAALLAALQARGLELRHGPIPVPPGNALEAELRDFLRAVQGAPLLGCSGSEGLACLEAALEVRNRVRESLSRMTGAADLLPGA